MGRAVDLFTTSERLATLARQGSVVTIDAMGTRPNIAQAIRDRDADDLLAVKGNPPTLTESMDDVLSAVEAGRHQPRLPSRFMKSSRRLMAGSTRVAAT